MAASMRNILNRIAKVASEFGIDNSTVTDLKKNKSRIRLLVSLMESLSVCSKERKIMRLADDEKVDKAVYKLIFHISEIVLAATISDMRGSTVYTKWTYLACDVNTGAFSVASCLIHWFLCHLQHIPCHIG